MGHTVYKLKQQQRNKKDEFYTLRKNIHKEIKHYKSFLKGKIVYCNCDTKKSNFWKYFYDNFQKYKLKELIISGINNKAYKYDGEKIYNRLIIKRRK